MRGKTEKKISKIMCVVLDIQVVVASSEQRAEIFFDFKPNTVLQRHIDGISFLERNAGPQIDRNMDFRGFQVTSGIDLATGFPTGGSRYNCGTWMDKMGESELANNKGVPSTPRDGSPVEIVGLCFAVVKWLAKMYRDGLYEHEGVKLSDGFILTWVEWATRIRIHFDENFWFEAGGYYGDSYGSSIPGSDCQLRCNFPIVLALGANITQDPSRAKRALETVDKMLQSGLGLRTLSSDDSNYRPNYLVEDSMDPATAKGANYHNGPSWVWPLGYHLLAKMNFSQFDGIEELLGKHNDHMYKSEWMGLPELQQGEAEHCPGSCPIQAWSHATLIEVAHRLSESNRIQKNRTII